MMTSLGHHVTIYSSEDNDAPCAEHVTCITKQEQASLFDVHGPSDILREPFVHRTYDPRESWWELWNQRVIEAMQARAEHQDFLCLIGGGVLFEPLLTAMPHLLPVEYAIGYAGVASRTHHCFGSSNWQHVVFGLQRYDAWRGRFYDRVIPHYFDPADFTYSTTKDDYLLYLGKIKEDKGVLVASRAAQVTGRRLILAGQGPTAVPYGEVLNRYVGPEERRDLLAHAAAVFVPSLYVEPFGMITVEALLSGTPVITTAFGALPEINVHGETGYVCHTLRDLVSAVDTIGEIQPADCRRRGLRYSMDGVRHEYAAWFSDLYGLWGEGWSDLSG